MNIFSRGLNRRGHRLSGDLLLHLSKNNRYFVDSRGNPVLIHGDTVWSAIVNFNQSDSITYLDDCVARGFNALIVNLLEVGFSVNAPNNIFDTAPFSGTAFQSAPVSAYFEHALWFIRQCASRGILCFINPCYLGYQGGAEGWHTSIEAATATQAQNWGKYVGTLLKNEDNIAYVGFGDFNPPSHARWNSIKNGIITTDFRHRFFGHHFDPDVSGHDDPEPWMTFDWIYRYDGFVHENVLDGYNYATTMPVLFCEGWYEEENGSATLDQRRQAWGSMFSGACGHFYGHRNIWACGSNTLSGQSDTWQNSLDATARVQMEYVKTFFSSRSWWLLVPDQASTFVTAGRGTITTAAYVTAAFASDGSWGAAYLPTGTTGGAITIAQTKFSGRFSWTWLNTRTGATNGGATNVANTGTQNFTAPDANDWVWVGEVD